LVVNRLQSSSGKQNVTVVVAELSRSWRTPVIKNDRELSTTLERIRHMQDQLALLRTTETNATNYRLSASGFIADIDRMQLDVREYLSTPAAVSLVG